MRDDMRPTRRNDEIAPVADEAEGDLHTPGTTRDARDARDDSRPDPPSDAGAGRDRENGGWGDRGIGGGRAGGTGP